MDTIVNGITQSLECNPDTPLAEVLPEELGLTGTKIGWGEGQCGACTVLVNKRPVRSCVYPVRHSKGPFSPKGIGELPSIPTAAAICKAIYNATGVRFYSLPVKPEDVQGALESS